MSLLRHKPESVAGLAKRLGLTRNAVRFHLASLERAGEVAQVGAKPRRQGGKPAALYMVTPAAESALSAAYAPLLIACLQQLRASIPPREVVTFLRKAGERVPAGNELGETAPISQRVRKAAELLSSLGAAVTVRRREGVYRLHGGGCPLGEVVKEEPRICVALEALLTKVIGIPVKECCDRLPRPRCCFEISAA
jgi:predicted ArsR family transcriptional regulator